MTVQEFAALKTGDKISNMFSGSTGTIDSTADNGVYVKWSDNSPPFFYAVNSTAWMHWTKEAK